MSNEIGSSEIGAGELLRLSHWTSTLMSKSSCLLTGILEPLLEVWSQNRSPILSLDIRGSMKNVLQFDR